MDHVLLTIIFPQCLLDSSEVDDRILQGREIELYSKKKKKGKINQTAYKLIHFRKSFLKKKMELECNLQAYADNRDDKS